MSYIYLYICYFNNILSFNSNNPNRCFSRVTITLSLHCIPWYHVTVWVGRCEAKPKTQSKFRNKEKSSITRATSLKQAKQLKTDLIYAGFAVNCWMSCFNLIWNYLWYRRPLTEYTMAEHLYLVSTLYKRADRVDLYFSTFIIENCCV